MKKILFYNITIITCIGLLLSACDDFLEKEYDATLSEEKTWSDLLLTRQFLTNIYTNLPDGFSGFSDDQFLGASRDCITDNAYSSWDLHFYTKIASDAYTANDHPLLGFWGTNLAGIRKCNQFMKNAKAGIIGNAEIAGDNNRLYDRYCAEARLLRALFHLELVNWFGNAPIIGDDANGVPIVFTTTDVEIMNQPRKKANEVLEWVANECQEIIDQGILPFRYSDEGINWGRINAATAYALRSRALLYRASALNNPDRERVYWENAAQAALAFITANNNSANPYRLYSEGSNPVSNYAGCFYGAPYNNNENILTRSVWNTNRILLQLIPPGFASGSGRTNPTQNFVDCFEMANGKRIDETGSLYDPQKPYANRDPRLEASVFYHGIEWGVANRGERRTIDVETDNGADYKAAMGGTLTGYYQKKFVNPYYVFEDASPVQQAWPIFRYAEILLNAAEAINEAFGPDNAFQYVDMVRNRVNMPAYGTAGYNQEELRKRIRNERRVELCFEDHRFIDLRRWMLYEGVTVENEKTKPLYEQLLNPYAMKVTKNGNNTIFTVSAPGENGNTMALRAFNSPKNYYFPIPNDQYKIAPNLGQNPGWEINSAD